MYRYFLDGIVQPERAQIRAKGVNASRSRLMRRGNCLASGLLSVTQASFEFSPKRASYICEVAALNFFSFVIWFLNTCFMIWFLDSC
jgi:hypothetical protein